MSNGDYDYFGKGDAGYAQYMTAFNRNFGGSSGGGGGGHNNNGGGGDKVDLSNGMSVTARVEYDQVTYFEYAMEALGVLFR